MKLMFRDFDSIEPTVVHEKRNSEKNCINTFFLFSCITLGPQNNISIWRKISSNTNSKFSPFLFIHLDNNGFEIDTNVQ